MEEGKHVLLLPAQWCCQASLQSSCNGHEEEGECKETPVFINGVDRDGHRRLMRQVFILLFNIIQNQVLALQEKVDSDTMICDAERV